MDEQRIIYLIRQYEQGVISPAEDLEFVRAIADDENHDLFVRAFENAFENHQAEASFLLEDYTEKIERILSLDKNISAAEASSSTPVGGGQVGAGQVSHPSPVGEGGRRPDEVGEAKVRKIRFNRWAVAASIVVAVSIASYFIIGRKTKIDNTIVITSKQYDVKAPSTSRAMITLSNGQKVYLDSAANGTLAQQGNTNITKTANGVVSYSSPVGGGKVGANSPSIGGGGGEAGAGGQSQGEVVYNTLSNPRGSQPITLTLSDGTQVWLNAESSLKYPVAFVGNERKVEITGEAYFEVAHNALKPFRVTLPPIGGIKGGLVEVLGTHFNINAYSNEQMIRTTLLQGSVKVSIPADAGKGPSGNRPGYVILKPGHQAIYIPADNAGIGEAASVDVESIIAWKNGFFSLKNQDFTSVMKQLERWYDITVKYEGNPPTLKFQGEMDRGVNLSDFVKYMQDLHINARIEGRVLIIAGK